MEGIRQYFISVIAIAILCGIVTLFFRDTGHISVIKMLSCLLITITVIKPVLYLDEIRFNRFWEDISVNSNIAVQQGKTAAENANAEYIMESMESYISSKAEEMGIDISVKVNLQADALQIPKEIQIIGHVSPYMKQKLADMIANDLAIPEDRQVWIS